jgi:hypothetical protein
MDLDDLLTRAAPPVAPRTPALDAELRALAWAVKPRPARRRRRLVVAGAVTAALLGTGVATATGAGPLPGGWLTTSRGSECQLEFFVQSGSGEPHVPAFTPEQEQATADAANSWLRSLDVDSIDKDRAVHDWQAAEAAARAGVTADERQPKLRGDDLETTAVYYAVAQQLSAYLRGQGLDPDAVVYSMGSRCE